MRTKIRNVISGSVVEKTFNPTDKFPTAFIERKDMQYLYQDGDLYYFMDNETYENIPITPTSWVTTSSSSKRTPMSRFFLTKVWSSAWSPPSL